MVNQKNTLDFIIRGIRKCTKKIDCTSEFIITDLYFERENYPKTEKTQETIQ